MADNRNNRQDSRRRPRRSRRPKFFFRKKRCFFCKNSEAEIDYKDVKLMKRFIAESGKITPRRFSGTCAKHQRKLSTEIKKARKMALLSPTSK
jgi:small subunit ribosomal protein S18